MADVVHLTQALKEASLRAVAEAKKDAWSALPQTAREAALLRQQLITPVLAGLERGLAPRLASQVIWAQVEALLAPADYLTLVNKLKQCSAATLERWTRDYLDGGLLALAPKRDGKQRKTYGWELRAIALWQDPNKRYYATVAMLLREEGWESATDHLVRRYIKSLPSHQAETSRKRVGKHYYQQNIGKHAIRTTDNLPVGFIYEGDGHTCDVYVAHPVTGEHYRPELTMWIDVKSRYIVGWWLSESESAQTTLFSLSAALVDHDHTPAYVHVDPGSGFKARVITDEVGGFLARFAVKTIFALPGNAKGKGLIEGQWRWFEEWCGKRFPTFCGHCRTDDALRRLKTRIERGELVLPSFDEYCAAIRAYVAYWNGHPMDALDGKAPKDLWAGLERVALEVPAAAVARPRERRTVQRWAVTLRKRVYRATELEAYERREVLVEYTLQHDGEVSIYDMSGRFVCVAPLVEKRAWLSDSHIEEAQQRRLDGQQKRLQARADEAEARARPVITTTARVIDAEAVQRKVSALTQFEESQPASAPETSFQRYGRWQRLDAMRKAGEALDAADTQWMATYETTTEFRGLRMVDVDSEDEAGW